MKSRSSFVVLVIAALTMACYAPTITISDPNAPPAQTGGGAAAPTNTQAAPAAAPATATDTLLPAPTDTTTVTPEPSITPTTTPSVPMVTPIKDPVNCRFGPGTVYAPLGAGLAFGNSAQIVGKSADGSSWQIQNPDKSGGVCWVAASVVTTTGNLTTIPVVAPPAAFVTDVTASVSPTTIQVPGCVFPVGYSFSGVITVNGPVMVQWHWELSQGNRTSPTETINFTAFGSHTLGDSYHIGSAGASTVKLVVTGPNNLIGIAKFKVVCT